VTDADLARWEAAERSGHRALGPDASGERILALIAEVRRRPAVKKIAALAMSGFGRRADARRALEAGFDAHVPKPASIDDIKAALQKV